MLKSIFGVFSDFPVLETSRLTLRRLLPRDKEDMFEYAQNPLVTKYLLWYEHESLAFTARYLKYLQTKYRRGEYFDWALVEKATGKMIGTVGFVSFDNENNAAEIGYVVSDKYWGRGYATEAVQRIMEFGFDELGINRIIARHIVGNDPSGRVMQKCGMSCEGTQRQSMYIKERYRDIVQYAILAQDFRKQDGYNKI